MGRPIKKIFIGEAGTGSAGGQGVASVTLAGTNNSTGYTLGAALTITAPNVPDGTQATGTVTIQANGKLTAGVTTFTAAGTGIDGTGGAAQTVATLTATGNTAGTGAVVSITKDNTNGVTDYSDISAVTITTPGSGYAIGETITILGTVFAGGASAANDLTLTVATHVTNGTLATLVVTNAGSGYTAAPTVTAATGTKGTATLTGVLTSNGANVIAATAFVTGGGNKNADILAQKGSTTYRVLTADGTEECTLVAKVPNTATEMQIAATDSAGGTYWVTKLMNRTVLITRNGGTQFASGARVKWADVAVVNVSVKITY